ncbi:FemAB family XrtA/PEP-CTERM system-associated protein [Ectothiorhodospira shaposhnikovii]|uniref:FemAB family XrtA/PEP-CTERM system-associated protein n=1 Tax=Ectothiorhodospira shaposhnikovii TaxID=1054 RepID=UPI003B83202B
MNAVMDTKGSDARTAPTIRHLEDGDEARWDAYVMACPEATFFHRSGWRRVLREAFGHPAHFLYAEQDGRIRGILPLGHVKTLLFGNALISMPFCVYGGVAADDEATAQALIDAARDLAEALQVDYLELRHQHRHCPQWPCKDDLYVTFRKPIEPEEEANLLAIPRKQRAMVRKGIKHGLASRFEDEVATFFGIYADSVRRLGTPVFSRRYFQCLLDTFGQDARILTVTHRDQPVSSVLSFCFRDEVLPYYGGGMPTARELAGFDFLYWEVMRHACAAGYRCFDYGRSKRGTGSFSFKKNWGFQPQPLYYEYHLVKADAIPEINPLNPKYRLFIEAWKRLPTPVANLIGPRLSRGLG